MAPAGHAEAVKQALQFILRSTRDRPQTEAEIRAKLAGRDTDAEATEAAVGEARRLGALDDPAFARAWVQDRGVRRGFGHPRLREELERRGVPAAVVDEALAALDGRDDLAVATELAKRRAQQLPASLTPEAAARRLTGYLERRGYAAALARRVAIEVSGLDRSWD